MAAEENGLPQRSTHSWAGTALGLALVMGLLIGAVFGNAALGASVGVVVGSLLEMAGRRSRSST